MASAATRRDGPNHSLQTILLKAKGPYGHLHHRLRGSAALL